jgi:hypothetical protein
MAVVRARVSSGTKDVIPRGDYKKFLASSILI